VAEKTYVDATGIDVMGADTSYRPDPRARVVLGNQSQRRLCTCRRSNG
jgi:hypothetical protein